MRYEIPASYKQASIKGGAAVVRFEVSTGHANFLDIVQLAGKHVLLSVEDGREQLPFFEDETIQAEQIEDEAHQLPEPDIYDDDMQEAYR